MPRRPVRKKCVICGGAVDLDGNVCSTCVGAAPSGSAMKRVALQVRNRLTGAKPETGDFICPYCRRELTWSTLGSSETEVTIYVREKIYFCPHCRAMLGVSSWHTEG